MQLAFDLIQDELTVVNTDLEHLKPTEMTLTEFMLNPKWEAYLDEKASKESKGNYRMRTPDGSDHLGGWIGKHKSADEAKMKFHERQIYWAIHGGKDLPERVLLSYPKLHVPYKRIHAYIQNITDGKPYVRVNIDGEERYFNKLDFPARDRVSVRSFVTSHGLHGKDGKRGAFFDSVEIASIALERALGLGRYSPYTVFPEYRDFENRSGVEVKFEVPTDFDEKNVPQRFIVKEGVTRFNAWSYGLRVYVESDDHEHFVFPSQLITSK